MPVIFTVVIHVITASGIKKRGEKIVAKNQSLEKKLKERESEVKEREQILQQK